MTPEEYKAEKEFIQNMFWLSGLKTSGTIVVFGDDPRLIGMQIFHPKEEDAANYSGPICLVKTEKGETECPSDYGLL